MVIRVMRHIVGKHFFAPQQIEKYDNNIKLDIPSKP